LGWKDSNSTRKLKIYRSTTSISEKISVILVVLIVVLISVAAYLFLFSTSGQLSTQASEQSQKSITRTNFIISDVFCYNGEINIILYNSGTKPIYVNQTVE